MSRRFGQYSKGMKRKLTIAAALMHRSPIHFPDEPTTGIDVASARQIRCGLFFPVAQLPAWLRPLPYALPLPYGADLLHGAVRGTNALPLGSTFSGWPPSALCSSSSP